MKTDRELLELAAKAAGIELIEKIGAHFIVNYCTSHRFGTSKPWDPLENDGDALRLAVKLDISVFGSFPFDAVVAYEGRRIIEAKQPGDPMPATRRAIVRAAAAIGESMK